MNKTSLYKQAEKRRPTKKESFIRYTNLRNSKTRAGAKKLLEKANKSSTDQDLYDNYAIDV